MESYKLIYFNMKGRAELIRFIFAQAGVKYEDERIISEQWPELKQKMPFGVVPVVVENGKQLSGSTTIARRSLDSPEQTNSRMQRLPALLIPLMTLGRRLSVSTLKRTRKGRRQRWRN